MKKTSDEELNQWRYQFPSAIVSWKISGDQSYAEQFRGEGKVLLYQVKNAMKFNRLSQYRMTKIFTDGTIIEAKSIFGHDEVSIDASRAISVIGRCSVTLINLPTIVAPMQFPGRIMPFEIEGKDYYKTYYTVDKSQCLLCTNELITLGLFTGLGVQGNDAILQVLLTQIGKFLFIYQNPKKGPNANIPGRKYNPNNHGIYGQGCYAEILGKRADSRGKYFLWKAYTEPWAIGAAPGQVGYSYLGKNGFGYMQARVHEVGANAAVQQNLSVTNEGVITSGETKIINEYCMGEGIVKVDCCAKPKAERLLRIWWLNPSSGGGFINDGIEHWFELTGTENLIHIGINDLLNFTFVEWAGSVGTVTGDPRKCMRFQLFPDFFGTCYLIDATLQGPGLLDAFYVEEPSAIAGQKDRVAGITNFAWCEPLTGLLSMCDEINIKVKDRCGTEKNILASCCDLWDESGDEFVIIYDSAQMGFSEWQIMHAHGGCWPYTWTTNQGTLHPQGYNQAFVIYTAPASNDSCTETIITCTDCCGHTAVLKIAVSSGYTGAALVQLDWDPGSCTEYYNGTYGCDYTEGVGYLRCRSWDCSTNVLVDCIQPIGFGDCSANYPGGGGCTVYGKYGSGGCYDCNACPWAQQPPSWIGHLTDVRSPGTLWLGCCPLDPFTGLPFD